MEQNTLNLNNKISVDFDKAAFPESAYRAVINYGKVLAEMDNEKSKETALNRTSTRPE